MTDEERRRLQDLEFRREQMRQAIQRIWQVNLGEREPASVFRPPAADRGQEHS